MMSLEDVEKIMDETAEAVKYQQVSTMCMSSCSINRSVFIVAAAFAGKYYEVVKYEQVGALQL